MSTETTSGWLFTAMIFGAIGAGCLIYGFRQKEPWTLGLGLVLNLLPLLAGETWSLMALSIVAIVAVVALKDRF